MDLEIRECWACVGYGCDGSILGTYHAILSGFIRCSVQGIVWALYESPLSTSRRIYKNTRGFSLRNVFWKSWLAEVRSDHKFVWAPKSCASRDVDLEILSSRLCCGDLTRFDPKRVEVVISSRYDMISTLFFHFTWWSGCLKHVLNSFNCPSQVWMVEFRSSITLLWDWFLLSPRELFTFFFVKTVFFFLFLSFSPSLSLHRTYFSISLSPSLNQQRHQSIHSRIPPSVHSVIHWPIY